jgi:crotonobetainyl-CoA:carnitine CoA-transferase CaiB-like acyl-CoA transferase
VICSLPLAGIRVLDFGHTVMGPTAGLILGDLGAEIIKIEPTSGDPTRKLRGFGSGYFGFLNRNKRSIAIDLKSAEGYEIVCRLIDTADVLLENFAPGTMERLKLDSATVKEINPSLIYASLKGFLKGPYDKRLALDEVVQMMSGLAYMTGPSGRPLRAGTSVVDITGGMFAVIGILASLYDRKRTGNGRLVETALFEACVFLMGQHLCYAATSDTLVPPMPERVSAWAVYELFVTADGNQVFVGITTDAHWRRFCRAVDRPDLANDPTLATNNQRIEARPRLIPIIQAIFAALTNDQMIAVCERAVIPFAPIARPEDLFTDPHLAATGGLLSTRLPGGTEVGLPRLPLAMSGADFSLRQNPPVVGQDTELILGELGFAPDRIGELIRNGVIRADAE